MAPISKQIKTSCCSAKTSHKGLCVMWFERAWGGVIEGEVRGECVRTRVSAF